MCRFIFSIVAVGWMLVGCAETKDIKSPTLQRLSHAKFQSNLVVIENQMGELHQIVISRTTTDGLFDEQGHFFAWKAIERLKEAPNHERPITVKYRLGIAAKCLALIPLGIIAKIAAPVPLLWVDENSPKWLWSFEGATLEWCAKSWRFPDQDST